MANYNQKSWKTKNLNFSWGQILDNEPESMSRWIFALLILIMRNLCFCLEIE